MLGSALAVFAADLIMTLDICISLALKQNRTITSTYLDRVAQKYDLRMAENKFVPTLVLTPSVSATGNTAALGGGTRTGNTNSPALPSGAGTPLTCDRKSLHYVLSARTLQSAG